MRRLVPSAAVLPRVHSHGLSNVPRRAAARLSLCVLVLLAVVALVIAGCSRLGGGDATSTTTLTTSSDGGTGPATTAVDDGGPGTSADLSATVELRVGAAVPFALAGAAHTAELLGVSGSSAEVVIASASPTTYSLTEGQSCEADLDADSLPDATLAVSGVSPQGATLQVAAIVPPTYDETGFQTAGGLAPYDVGQHVYPDPSLVLLDDGSYLLFYATSSAHRVQWERYGADGAQVLTPQLGAGRTPWVPGGVSEQFDPVDTARVGDAVYMTFRSNRSTWIARYGLDLRERGVPVYLTPWDNSLPLATDGSHLWLGTNEMPPGAGPLSRAGAAVMEIAPGTPPLRLRSRAVTTPPDKSVDGVLDLAFDAGTGTLAVVYLRRDTSLNQTELRLVVVDPAGLTPVRDLLIAGREAFADAASGAVSVLAEDGEAFVYWESAAPKNQHISVVDLRTGAVRTPYASNETAGIDGLTSEDRDVELVRLPSGPAVLFLHRTAAPEGTEGSKSARQRFVLQPIDENGANGDPIVLDGGQPVLADVTFDLLTLGSNPKKAVCGSPCLLTGSVVNRGSRDARKVALDVLVEGTSIGTLALGTIKPGASATFAKVWDVPAGLTAEQVKVTYRLTTTEAQYTVDNDTYQVEIPVRQKGVVQGRVTDASGVTPPDWWAGGLAGVTVSFGGRTVLTDAAGAFAIEEVEFGAGTLTAEKAGYNPATLTVETSRTRPIASAGIRMDNHGTLRIRVTDESGALLPGVQVFMPGYDRTDTTGATGEAVFNIPAGSYRFAFKKTGYSSVPPTAFAVALGGERVETVTMREATTGKLSGHVVDRRGAGVAGATVVVKDGHGDVVARPEVSAGGDFAEVELPVKPSGAYVVVATGDPGGGALTVEEPVSLTGGEVASVLVALVPGRGELAERSATEGYTSWMLKASWPGFLDVSGQSIYVWYGNYAMRIGAQYWDGSRELARLQVTSWGGTYETHVTKGEIEFDVSGDDLTGSGGKKLPKPMGQVTDAKSQSWWKSAAKSAYAFYDENKDAFDLGKQIFTGIKKVKEAWSDEDQWIVLGQGPELLTWKQALDDFLVRPSWDGDHPLDSVMSVKDAIPTSFAIPIVIGGSSVQETAVRVDGVDVVDKETGEVYLSDRAVWYSYQDPDGDGSADRDYEMTRADVPAEGVRVLVWVTVQKYWLGAPGGTCFDQREQQVVIFDPGTGGMKAFIAPGDTYQDPERWTTAEIARLTGD